MTEPVSCDFVSRLKVTSRKPRLQRERSTCLWQLRCIGFASCLQRKSTFSSRVCTSHRPDTQYLYICGQHDKQPFMPTAYLFMATLQALWIDKQVRFTRGRSFTDTIQIIVISTLEARVTLRCNHGSSKGSFQFIMIVVYCFHTITV